jgi:hypothetical protein
MGRAEQRPFRWTWALTPQQWRGFVSTVSHVRLLPGHERAAALDETEQLVSVAEPATAPLTYDALCARGGSMRSRRLSASATLTAAGACADSGRCVAHGEVSM